MQAKVRSWVFNIAAILFAGADILFFLKLCLVHWNEDGFLQAFLDPFVIGLFVLPLIIAFIFMVLSKRNDRIMAAMLKQHREELSKRMHDGHE